jgi:nucleoside-diphosphate-sugar epimerase
VPAANLCEKSKAEAHAIALRYREEGAPVDIICPANVIGPGDHSPWGCFARLYVRGMMPPFGWAPEATFTFVYVDDAAEAMALAAVRKTAGETYFLGAEPISIGEIVKIWGRTPGGFKPFLWLPRTLAMLSGALAEPVLRLLGQTAFFSREVVRTSFENWQYSAAKARRELGAAFLDAEEMWIKTLEGERALMQRGTA